MGKRDALVVEEGMKWVKNQKPCGNHKNNKERRNRLIVRMGRNLKGGGMGKH